MRGLGRNLPLSQRRVATVRDALIQAGGGGGPDRDRHVRYGSFYV